MYVTFLKVSVEKQPQKSSKPRKAAARSKKKPEENDVATQEKPAEISSKVIASDTQGNFIHVFTSIF